MPAEHSRIHNPDWRARKMPLHWRVGIPIADVAELLGASADTIESRIARCDLPAQLIDGWVLIAFPTLIDPDRDESITMLYHAWAEVMQWESDVAGDTLSNCRPHPVEECICDGCLTHFRGWDSGR